MAATTTPSLPSRYQGVSAPTGGLRLFLIGPGFGEAQVCLLPDGSCVVVDCCYIDGRNAVRDLLTRLEVTTINLLVVTHPDRDHIRGVAELLQDKALTIGRVWRWPGGNLTEALARLCATRPKDRRLQELHRSLVAIDEADSEACLVEEVQSGTCTWTSPDGQVSVQCIAPSRYDVRRQRAGLEGCIQYDASSGATVVREAVRSWVAGDSQDRGEVNNRVSLALVVQWGGVKILLAGDVERGDSSPNSGWSGVIRALTLRHQLDSLRRITAVKAAHHGSKGAYFETAWAHHSKNGDAPVELVLIAPFNGGKNPPPHEEFANAVKRHATRIVLTADEGGALNSLQAGGWAQTGASSASTDLPYVLCAFSVPDGPATLIVGQPGSVLQQA